MKKLLIVVGLLFSSNLFAQNNKAEPFTPVLLVREYMKVEPGMEADYLKTEQVWKKVHQRRVAEGKILNWALYRCLMPSGTGTPYDYMTVTTTKDGKQLGESFEMTWDYITKGMSADELTIANNTEKTRKTVSRSMYRLLERVQPGGRYIQLTHLKANVGQGGKLESFEKMMNPVFVEVAKSGKISSWRFGERLYPITPESGNYYRVISTNTMEDMINWSSNTILKESFKKVYPAKDYDATMKAIRDIITIQTVQLWERVDQTN